MSEVRALAEKLVALEDSRREHKKLIEALDADIEQTEGALYTTMLKEGMSSAKYPDLGHFIATSRKFPRVRPEAKDREEEVFDVIRAAGHGSVIRLQVNPQTLKSTLKEMADDGFELPGDLFEIYEKTGVTIRKA